MWCVLSDSATLRMYEKYDRMKLLSNCEVVSSTPDKSAISKPHNLFHKYTDSLVFVCLNLVIT